MLPVFPLQVIGKELHVRELLDGEQMGKAENLLLEIFPHLGSELVGVREEENLAPLLHRTVGSLDSPLYLGEQIQVAGEDGGDQLDGRMGVGGSQFLPP